MKTKFLIIFFLGLAILVQAQEKEKNKGGFKKFLNDMKKELLDEGKITKNSVDEYYNALVSVNENDTAAQKMLADTSLHISFMSKLTKYDEKLKSFFITASRYNLPTMENSSGKYKIFMKNIQDFRHIPMSDEQIREAFNTKSFGNDANVPNMKKGDLDVRLNMYMKLDTAYTLDNGLKIIDGRVTKMEVEWKYSEYGFLKIAEIVDRDNRDECPYCTILEETALYKYLQPYPFLKDEDWPRIAITIDYFPRSYMDINPSTLEGQLNRFYNLPPILMRATIWNNENEKIEVPDFCYFPADFKTFGEALVDLSIWGIGSMSALTKENTGYGRTEGPVPPKNPLPQTPSYHKEFFGVNSNGIIFLGDLLNKIGYDWNRIGDRRVWVNISE